MSETYVHKTGEEFRRLPEVYQIEITNACNLKCPMCLRSTHMVRPDQLLDIHLLQIMHERGDFQGTQYVELQMAGEPTLHPKLQQAIRFLKEKVGVLVGLSTHGLQIRKNPQLAFILLELDALTISVDSLDPETYHKMRFPATIEQLLESLDIFFQVIHHNPTAKLPFIELQLVVTSMFEKSGDVSALEIMMHKRGWDKYASVRTTADCFGEMQERVEQGTKQRNTELCMNPFMSVSVAQNGDVVSCCFIFQPDKNEVNYYGNLYEHSLADIWANDRVKNMRLMHITNSALGEANIPLTGQCAKCYLKSPTLIHQNILSRLVRGRRLNG